MATNFSIEALSGGTNGRPVLVATTASPGTTIHAEGAGDYDLVVLWAYNTHTADVEVTFEIGGTSQPMKQTIPPGSGAYVIFSKDAALYLSAGDSLAAFATVANVVKVGGYVMRATTV